VVTGYLVKQGVDPKLIKTQGFGSTYPVAGNDTPEGRALNRRTEIILPR
jgi:outer membrane protein OmpA-like peptidoglycan-associated protein